MDSESVLLPLPGAEGRWSIARVALAAADLTPFVQSLAAFGVELYPAGNGRSVLSLARYGAALRPTIDAFLADRPGAIEVVGHDDYDSSWRLPSEPVAVAPGLAVVSSRAEVKASRGTIVLEPGLAFGECRHPTTRLAATALERLAEQGPIASVLDVGCGSGILALVAARLGAAHVSATDIDPYSCFVARHNAALNGLALDVVDAFPPPTERFAVVVANIWVSAFAGLAAQLEGAVGEGGTLILSGFPDASADDVAALFRGMDAARFAEDGWCALVLTRASS
jgi:ribosomal protein L11 methyltransferase